MRGLFLILILSIYSCTDPISSSGQDTPRPTPYPDRNLTGFTLQPQSACSGESIEIQGAHYTPHSPLFLVFQTAFNPNNTSPSHADTLIIQALETDAEGHIQSRFQLPGEVQRQPEGAGEALASGNYTALLVNTSGNFHNRIDFEVRDCSPSVATGGIPSPPPGSGMGWPEDLEPGVHLQPVFELTPAAPCPGEEISLKLVSSGFGRSQLPIALFPAPQSQPVDVETPGGNKYPPPQDNSTVALGELSISPLGTGELRWSLQNSYTTRGGQAFEVHDGQRYLLYWQARPDAFTYITDIVPHNCPTES